MGNYPSRSDIVTAMTNPNVSFKSNELIGGNVIQKGSRVVQYAGGYTTVFPFIASDSKKVAIRCWIADIGDAKKRSQEISKFLKNLNSKYFVDFKYIDDAILINGKLFPVVVMEWVNGQTIKEYVNNNINNSAKILKFAEDFKEMVIYFHNQNISHGDLQHGNILIKDNGELVAIDYDSMYIDTLKGMNDSIKGLPGYQHPARINNNSVQPYTDYFSELVIYLSLLVYSDEPSLWNEYYETEDLLFSKDDFSNPNNSKLINKLLISSNPDIVELTEKLIEELSKNDLSELIPLEELLIDKREVTKESIFDKMEKQPNPPEKKKAKLPNPNDITNKF